MNIIIKDDRRYKQRVEKNGYIRSRQLCILENCNYISLNRGFCKKHTLVDELKKTCNTCLRVKDKNKFVGNSDDCGKCVEKCIRKADDYVSTIVIENNKRYMVFKNAGKRKLCKIETCMCVSSGDYCRKHTPVVVDDKHQQCPGCLSVRKKTDFTLDSIEFKSCSRCREYNRKTSLKRHSDRRVFLLQLKIDKGGKCVDCGTTDLELLEFDHITTDKVNVVRRIYNYEGMKNEADKCVLRCCTCHMIKTEKTVTNQQIDETSTNKMTLYLRKMRKIAREYIRNVKLNCGGCTECGWFDERYLRALHFDHIDHNNKSECVSTLMKQGSKLETLQAEIDKTRILCANCHRKRTLRQFNYPILDLIKNL